MELISNFNKITKIALFYVLIQIKNPWDIQGIYKTLRGKIIKQQDWKIKEKQTLMNDFSTFYCVNFNCQIYFLKCNLV